MSHVTVQHDRGRLQNPVFIEGLPGVGLVGKIATDHLVMSYYASVSAHSLAFVSRGRSK